MGKMSEKFRICVRRYVVILRLDFFGNAFGCLVLGLGRDLLFIVGFVGVFHEEWGCLECVSVL